MDEWISMKAKAPDKPGTYLVFVKAVENRGAMMVCEYVDYADFKAWAIKAPVTHWRPLPEPPAEGGGEDG